MRKLFLCIAMVAFAFTSNAQQGKFSAGINLGLPTGDANTISSFVLGAEANYMFEIADQFQAGAAVSFVNYFGKSIGGETIDSFSFIPIAAAGRFSASEDFVVGADLGYALGISPDGNDGGFYYRPMVGYNLNEKIQITASYSGISLGGDGEGTISNFGLGVMFAF